MRQALFAIVLIAASFAGGAFINGPGLQWARTAVMDRFGVDAEEDQSSTDAKTPDSVAHADNTPTSTIAPLAKEPSFANSTRSNDPAETQKPAVLADAKLTKANEPSDTSGSTKPTVQNVAAALLPNEAPPSLEAPEPLPLPLDAEGASPDPSVALTSMGSPPEPLLPAPTETVTNTNTKAKPKAPEADSGSSTEIPETPNSWSEVRKTLKELGVTRYGTEGETNGKVRFYCLIPLAGRKAVGQHFEAIGSDELDAAQATIRRIALWKATEDSKTSP